MALMLAPRLATGVLARDVAPFSLVRARPVAILGPMWLVALLLLTLVLPLAGFIQPLLRDFPAGRALQEIGRTLGDTAFYGIAASFLATMLGVSLAVCAGREARLRVTLAAILFLLLALPPSLGASGWIHLAGVMPAPFDSALRSSFTVGLALALRFFPVAAIFAMRSLGTTSPSWANAAAVHGVPLEPIFENLAPLLAGAFAPRSTANHPPRRCRCRHHAALASPGKASLPLAIFTVMANAPESLVGALCLFYVAGAAALLVIAALFARQWKEKA